MLVSPLSIFISVAGRVAVYLGKEFSYIIRDVDADGKIYILHSFLWSKICFLGVTTQLVTLGRMVMCSCLGCISQLMLTSPSISMIGSSKLVLRLLAKDGMFVLARG